MKAQEIQAPNKLPKKVFLAGSIGLPDSGGEAENWQEKIIRECSNESIIFLNPRRTDWDSSWTQSIQNYHFREQVEWELNSLEEADHIVMYFDPNTKSPISLLELGLHARSGKLIVCCPEGFWRKGNVDIVCNKYNIYQTDNIENVIQCLKNLK